MGGALRRHLHLPRRRVSHAKSDGRETKMDLVAVAFEDSFSFFIYL